MKLHATTVTHRDSCKTYALKRLGIPVNMDTDTPSIKDLYNSRDFDLLDTPEIGCLLIWADASNGKPYFQPHHITEDGRIVLLRRSDYGHCAIYERDDMVSDLVVCDEFGTFDPSIRLRRYADISSPPTYILKYKIAQP